MSSYLLGLDNGNTLTKAALFDLQGRELAAAGVGVETLSPQPGYAERDMDGLWSAAAKTIRQVVQRAGIDAREIAAVGCCGHGNGVYLLDADGAPLGNAIQSIDTRAAALLAEWQNAGRHEQAFPYTSQAFYPAQTAVLLAWLKRYDPARYARIGQVLLCKDYINYRLTGQIATDYTDISATSLLDVLNRRYAPALLRLYGLEDIAAALPAPVHSAGIIGQITEEAAQQTGLPAGIPVAAGMIDIQAGAIGTGVVRPGQGCIIAGTWSINEVVTEQPLISRELFLTTIFADPAQWLAVEASATSTTNLTWFVEQFCTEEQQEAERRGISVYDVCGEVVAALLPADHDPIFHPYLHGSSTQPTARAGFYGMAGWHTRAHALRAVFEGVVFSHLQHVERLRRAGAVFETARLSGGAAQSAIWPQMFADALGVPVEITSSREAGALGAALAAGVGVGVYDSYESAAQQAVTVTRTCQPDSAATIAYQRRYQIYQQAAEALRDTWDHLDRLNRQQQSVKSTFGEKS
jgi:L-xylulokinase